MNPPGLLLKTDIGADIPDPTDTLIAQLEQESDDLRQTLANIERGLAVMRARRVREVKRGKR